MRQVWAENHLRLSMDHYGDPYLLDYHLLMSAPEGSTLGPYTRFGSMVASACQGIDGMEPGHSYRGNLIIMEDDEGELYRFSNVDEMIVMEVK